MLPQFCQVSVFRQLFHIHFAKQKFHYSTCPCVVGSYTMTSNRKPENDYQHGYIDDYGFTIPDSYFDAYNAHLEANQRRRENKARVLWSDFPFDEKNALSVDRKTLTNLVYRVAPPKDRRGLVWLTCSGALKKKQNANLNSETGHYYGELMITVEKILTGYKKMEEERNMSALKAQHEGYGLLFEINKDIKRTFPFHPYFQEANIIATMKRVLLAFGTRNSAVGYCQSMNFVVAWSLMFMKEEDAFWLLTTLVEDLCAGVYSKSMYTIRLGHKVLRALIAGWLPELHAHLESLMVSLPLITTKWYMCLFVESLPSETVLRLWDRMFLEGPQKIMVQASLALFKLYEKDLMRTHDPHVLWGTMLAKMQQLFNPKILTQMINKVAEDVSEELIEDLKIKLSIALNRESMLFKKKQELAEISKFTRFSREELEKLRVQFEHVAKQSQSGQDVVVFDFEKFAKVFCYIFPSWTPDDPTMKQLFRVFDENDNGRVEFRELVVALSILTKGTLEEKLRLWFKSYDVANTGYIRREDLIFMLQGVYEKKNLQIRRSRLLTADSIDDDTRKSYVFPEDMMNMSLEQFVDRCFTNLDRDGDGKLSVEDFVQVETIDPQLAHFLVPDDSCELENNQIQIKLTASLDENSVPSKAPPGWEADKDVTHCRICKELFIFPIKRKHHCRMCGRVVCRKCSEHYVAIPRFNIEESVRVCDDCFRDCNNAEIGKESINPEAEVSLP